MTSVNGDNPLSEGKDYYGKAKEEMRLSERLAAALPGFHGYKEKELRRESDRLIRNHLYRQLSSSKSDIRGIFQKLSDHRAFEVMTDMDQLVAKFDRISEKVNHASYGYSGFFDVIKIKEENLDRMINFDNGLEDDVAKIGDEVSAFKAEVNQQKLDTAKAHIQTLTTTLEDFEKLFDSREEVILGAS